MAPRPLLYTLLALAFVLGGCTDAAPGNGEGSGDEGSNGEDDARGPFAHLVPGVEQVPLPSGSRGLLQGVVYDVSTGEALPHASVVAFCVRGGLPDVAADPTAKSLPVKDDGSFSSWAPAAFVDCATVVYEVEAAGYELAVPLESGSLQPPEQQYVNAGMVPLDD